MSIQLEKFSTTHTFLSLLKDGNNDCKESLQEIKPVDQEIY